MSIFIFIILRYPYPYVEEYRGFVIIFLLITGSIAYGLYKLITWKIGESTKSVLDSLLVLAVVLYFVIFIIDMTFSLITTVQVNRQLGFCYATPYTPEREIFEIQKVRPGKPMDQAGLKRFDQIQMNNVNDFYRLLINNQGKEVVFAIKRNDTLIDIRLTVPDLSVPFAGVSFILF